MKFKFHKEMDYGRNGPIFYKTNEIHLEGYSEPKNNKVFVWAKYTMRVNGPKTAYAIFYRQIRWPTNPDQWLGFNLSKHFDGNNAGLKARRWINWLLNNCPMYVGKI